MYTDSIKSEKICEMRLVLFLLVHGNVTHLRWDNWDGSLVGSG